MSIRPARIVRCFVLSAAASAVSCDPSAFDGYCGPSDPGCGSVSNEGGLAGAGGGAGGASAGGSGGAGGQGGVAGAGGTGGGGTEVFAETTLGGGGWYLTTGGGYVYFAVHGPPTSVSTFIILRKSQPEWDVETVAVSVPSTPNDLHLFADEKYIYWTTPDTGVMTASHADVLTQTIVQPGAATPPFGPRRYATNASGHTCMAQLDNATTLRITGSAWGIASIVTGGGGNGISAFDIDATGVCYVAVLDPPAGSKLYKVSSSAPQAIVDGIITGIGFSGTDLYYAANPTTSSIYRHGNPPTLLATGVYMTQIAVDSEGVYYGVAGTTYQAMRVPLAGGSPVVLGDSSEPFTTLRLGAGYVYWTGTSSNTSMRVFRAPR